MTSFEMQFNTYIGSGFPLISIDTIEIERCVARLKELVDDFNKGLAETTADEMLKTNGLKLYLWDCVNGLYPYENKKKPIPNTISPGEVLRWLAPVNREDWQRSMGVYVLQNFQFFWNDSLGLPEYIQLMKDFAEIGRVTHRYMVLVGGSTIPKEIQNYFVTMDFPLPNREEIETIIKTTVDDIGVPVKKSELRSAAEAVAGMSEQEIIGAVCMSCVKNNGKKIDKETLFDEKAKAVRKSGLLEYIHTEESIDTIGGLDPLKEWITQIARSFKDREAAEKYGLIPPKGAMFVGVSGTGKTLTAKALASIFEVPLFRLDVGRIFSSLVGSTEANTRELLRLIDAVSPAIILLDEAEKSLAGLGSSDSSDSGVTARFISSILYYMEEKRSHSFIAMTANDISKLPPELLRPGRLDALWFVDLPTQEERENVFTIHLRKVKRNPEKFDIKRLAKECDGYTGAEIMNSIKSAMFRGFSEKREFTTDDILEAIKETIPMLKTKGSVIERLRAWGRDNARLANGYRKEAKKGLVNPLWIEEKAKVVTMKKK